MNLVGKHDRKAQSHDIAKRIREQLVPVARALHATIQIVEVPPGPPVLAYVHVAPCLAGKSKLSHNGPVVVRLGKVDCGACGSFPVQAEIIRRIEIRKTIAPL